MTVFMPGLAGHAGSGFVLSFCGFSSCFRLVDQAVCREKGVEITLSIF